MYRMYKIRELHQFIYEINLEVNEINSRIKF